MTAEFRRIVTGHDKDGRSIIQQDGPPDRFRQIGGEGGPVFYEVWNTRETPALLDRASGEPPEEGIILAPPPNGTRIRVIDMPPDSGSTIQRENAREVFSEIGAEHASSAHQADASHATMHRTQTIDYGIVLEGEVVLIMDEGEVTARAGDIIVQRGTNHGWANRSNTNCRIAFVLIDGRFEEGLT